MLIFSGMQKRMKRVWMDDFGALPPVFWLPALLAIITWTIPFYLVCLGAWFIGYYGCEKCEKTKHRFKERKVTATEYYYAGAYDTHLCKSCNEENEAKELERRNAEPHKRPGITVNVR